MRLNIADEVKTFESKNELLIYEKIDQRLQNVFNADRFKICKCGVQSYEENNEIKKIEVTIDFMKSNRNMYNPLSQDELKLVEVLVKEIIGYDEERWGYRKNK